MKNTSQQQNGTILWIRGWLLLTALIGGICLYSLASVGETSFHSVFLGYSASRLAMMGALLICILIGLLGFISGKGKTVRIILTVSKTSLWKTLLTVLFLVFSFIWIWGGALSNESFTPYFQRIQPLLIYAMFISGTGTLLLHGLNGHSSAVGSERIAIRKTACVFFLIGIIIWLFIRLTGIGLVPDEMEWQPTGMALQYWELCLSIWIALAGALLIHAIHANRHRKLTAVIIFLAIWIATAILWVSVPSMEVLSHSYFNEITAPNYLPYPASDAAFYGLWSESILAGFGFKSDITTRPFYITVLAGIEALTHGDLLKTIDWLTVILALIPACIYLLGWRLHSHGAGLIAAGSAAWREYNTILLAPHYMVSSSKMLLTDVPALLCMLAVICMLVDWFQNPRSVWRLLLAGCMLGLSVILRSQFAALIPFPIIFFLMRKGLPFKKRILPAIGFGLAVLIVIAPWLIRSKIITGEFLIDDPSIHSTELARRYSDDINNVVTRNSGETDAEYAARNTQHMIDFFLEKPLYVLHFISSHFFANEIYAFSALPYGTDPGLTIHDVTNTDFHDVNERLMSGANIPIVFLFLALVAIGMAASWKRAGWAGLLPLTLCTVYLLCTASGRYSGWRFVLPADWFFYFYFALGIAETAFQIAAIFSQKPDAMLSVPKLNTTSQPLYPAAIAGILVLFLFLGLSPALIGEVIPQQVFMQTSAENITDLQSLTENYPEAQKTLATLLDDPQKIVINGRIIYPRFFYKGQGLASGHPWIAYRIRGFSRLGFVLLNEENHDVILPLKTEPSFIPNAADIYVIGNYSDENGEAFFLADAVIIPQTDQNAVPRILTAD